MTRTMRWAGVVCLLYSCLALAQAPATKAYPGTITLAVDASAAPTRIFHARLAIPVRPGPLTLLYPKWIPGEHGPTGPIVDLTGLKMSAGGQTLQWRRDDVDMYTFHVNVPAGASQLDVSLDYTSPVETEHGFTAGTTATEQMMVLSWNWVLLYPAGYAAEQITYKPSLRLPTRWEWGTPLPALGGGAGTIEFNPVSLYTLVDSPVIAGRNFRVVRLTAPGANPGVEMDIASDSAAALQMTPQLENSYKQLVAEATTLFGATHYRDYHFLLSLSDHVAHFGLEHHEANDSRTRERGFVDPEENLLMSGLLPHEYTHSWNGKYRRPAGLATPDYEQPMKGELLWVYEGLTDYLGNVLSARSGLRTAEQYRDELALIAAQLDTQAGRSWRPLIDTTMAAQILYDAPTAWTNWRRSVDYYPEGDLVWLGADMTIRKLTNNAKSLDDFCKLFFGQPGLPVNQAPRVNSYTFDDLVNALNQTAPYDWRKFWNDRLWSTSPHAPLGGIETSGWKLIYDETPGETLRAQQDLGKYTDVSFSLGFMVNNDDGRVLDVVFGSPAHKAGLAPGMRLEAVNGRAFKPEILHDALKAGKTASEPLQLLVRNAEYFRSLQVDYHGGDRYPHLVRNEQPDSLSDITRGHATPIATRP